MEQQDELPPYSVFFDFVIPGIFLNFVGLLGLLGNVLSIIVLSRPQMRSSINCILIGKKFALKTRAGSAVEPVFIYFVLINGVFDQESSRDHKN